MNLLLLYLPLSVWLPDWTNYGINELLIRAEKKPVIFLGTRPLEYREFKKFITDIDPTDSVSAYLQEHLTAIIENPNGIEYNIGLTKDSLADGFFLVGRQFRKGVLNICVEPIAKIGESKKYPNVLWKDVIGADYLKGYIKLSMFNFSLLVGRAPMKWGPSPREELLISGTAPPFDMLQASYLDKKYKFSFFATQLDQYEKINRYLSGHRIEYSFTNSFYLSASEVALFGGKGQFPELYYLNPLFVYYPYQWNRDSNVNILWSIDSRLLFKNFGLFAELMIDDYPYEKSEANDPPKLGVNCGVQGAVSKIYWLFEYKGVTRWTYNHLVDWERYTYLNYLIGHSNGPDFDEFFLGLNYHAGKNIDIILDGSLVRKGEGTMAEKYPDIFPKNEWLTGELKNTYNIWLGLKWYRFPGFIITCKSGCIIDGNRTFHGVSFFVLRPGELIL